MNLPDEMGVSRNASVPHYRDATFEDSVLWDPSLASEYALA
jgi:hypothetical protein